LSQSLNHLVASPPIRDEVHTSDWISGASMIVRRQVFEEVGLLDEEYLQYFEEVDFSRQVREKGWLEAAARPLIV